MDKPRHPQVIRPWKPVRRIPGRVPKTNPRKPLPPKKAREVRGRVSGDTMRHGNARAAKALPGRCRLRFTAAPIIGG